jgi:hypothetical protein
MEVQLSRYTAVTSGLCVTSATVLQREHSDRVVLSCFLPRDAIPYFTVKGKAIPVTGRRGP